MPHRSGYRPSALLLFVLFTWCVFVGSTPAFAQDLRSTSSTPVVGASIGADLFAPLPQDFRQLASWNNVWLIGAGMAGAAAGHSWDNQVAAADWGRGSLRRALQPGQLAGNTLVHSGAALAVYAVGRTIDRPGVAALGADLFRAQLVAQATTQAIKFTSHRTRPDGTSLSFPSGHTASTVAMATVLQRHLGWKVGVPAYVAAAWVGASRIQQDRHYVSDVIAGAVVGLAAGRSVTIGRGRTQFALTPVAVPGGIGVSVGLSRN